MIIAIIFLAVLLAGFLSRGSNGLSVQSDDPALRNDGQRWLYHNAPFSGTIIEHHIDGAVTAHPVRLGVSHGRLSAWDARGKLRLMCEYSKGKKEGHEYEWWPNSKLKRHTFVKAGVPVGRVRTWYSNGQLFEDHYYDEIGQEVGKQTVWGKDGRRYRTIRPNTDADAYLGLIL